MTQHENKPHFCPTCGQFIADYKTRARVAKFASDGVDTASLVDSVVIEPTAPQMQVTLINPLSGPVAAGLALSMVGLLGSPVAFQFGLINGPLSSLLMIGSFCTCVFICGSSPRIIGTTVKQVASTTPAPTDAPGKNSQVDEVAKPGPNSLQIRFYEPPLRKSGKPVAWESICYACRAALNGTPFSEREIAGPKGSKISGPDFRLLADDFRRRGYTTLLPNAKTAFTDRGAVQVKKLADLPY